MKSSTNSRKASGKHKHIDVLDSYSTSVSASPIKLARILDAIPDNILFVDKHLKINWLNNAAAISAGIPRSKAQSKTCYEVWFKRKKTCSGCPVIHAIKTGIGETCVVQTPDGKWWDVKGEPVRDSKGKIIGAIDFARNITQVVEAEASAKRSRALSETILKYSPSPIVVIGIDSSIRYVNPAFEKLTGFRANEVNGHLPPYPWWIDRKGENIPQILSDCLSSSIVLKYERNYKRRNGQVLSVELTAAGVTNEEDSYCIFNWVDITESKRLREYLEYYISQIIRTQEEERKRLSRELHDTIVQDLIRLQLDFHAMSSRSHDFDKRVESEITIAQEIDRVIDEVRSCSQRLRPGLLDQLGLRHSLRFLVDDLQERTGILCSIEMKGERPEICCDIETIMYRIVQECLNNVMKHAKATKVHIKIAFLKSKVSLSVVDNGVGFTVPTDLSVFIHRGKLGIVGLFERARLVNGTVRINSKVGKGTKISVAIPISILPV